MSSTAGNGEEPSKKKKKKKEPISNPSLPDDLIVSCLARVSRLRYPNLSLVSKNFRSFLSSPELFMTRCLLGCSETFLYVCLRFPDDDEANPRWFFLYRQPNQARLSNRITKTKKESSGTRLAPIPVLNSPPTTWLDLVAVGSYLYAINAGMNDASCSNVSFLDCRTHTWLEAPSMRLAHTNGVFDGRMYLVGSCEKADSLNCVQVYNTKTQTWNPVPPEKRIFNFRNMQGKVYMTSDALSGVALNLKDFTCEAVGIDTDSDPGSVCMIDNIIYFYVSGRFLWRRFGTVGTPFIKLEGLQGLPKFAKYSTVKLAGHGGKLVVLWDKYVPASGYKEKMIWCAEISLEKRTSEELWGKVDWFDAVLTVPKSYKFVCAIAATV